MSFYHDPLLLEELLKIKQKYNYSIFIETGTEMGNTVRTLVDHFDIIYSCEIDDKYYTSHTDLETNPKVKLYKGDSSIVLKDMLNEMINSHFYLYLDAHWGVWPLKNELKLLKESKLTPILIIHDFDCNTTGLLYDIYDYNGVETKLDWDFIKEDIISIYGENGYDYHYNTKSVIDRGCVFIYPR